MKTLSAEKHLLQSQWSAMRQVAEHTLLDETYWLDGARWLIGRPGTCMDLCEIIVGAVGSLLVHGDHETCRFACCWDDPWPRLLWMADHCDVGYYVAQKAAIGSPRSDVSSYVPEVALHELRERLEQVGEPETEADRALCEILEEAQDYVGNQHELRTFLSEHDNGYDFWEWHVGEVLSYHVVFAHMALNRCAWLLRAKYGPGGPPVITE